MFQKKLPIKTVIIAAIPSITIIAIFIFFLHSKGILFGYYTLNYEFNKALVYYFERGRFWFLSMFSSLYGVALFVACFYFKSKNIYFRIIAILYISEFLMRVFYFSPHPNYYTLLTFLAAATTSMCAIDMISKYKFLSLILLISLFINLGYLFNKLEKSTHKSNSYKHFTMADYIHKNSNNDDYLMNGYDMNFNIYRKDVSYYWFGLDMLLPIIEHEYGLNKQVDVNALILRYKPKFVYTKNHINLFAYRAYGEKKFTQKYIPEIINNLYVPTPFENLVTLK
jgi:hypothetical protein